MLKVSGRVYVKETGAGLPGLHVKAVDKDLFFDDVVGTAVTGQDGRYEITYERKDFSELFERAPDLYLVVRDAQNRRILHTSEDHVRWDAGAEETIDVAIPQSEVDAGTGAPRPPYGPEKGTAKIRLNAGAALPDEVRLFFSEHRDQNRGQHAVTARSGEEISVDLPSGEYTVQVQARGFETFRGLVEIDPKRPFVFDAALKPRRRTPRTFEERLAKYGIDPKQTEIGNLDVPANTTRALNFQEDGEKRGFKMLQADTIGQIKEWIGNSTVEFGHDRPVYGKLPEEHLGRLRDGGNDLRQIEPEMVKAVTMLAREYVQGNSRSVALYENLLNEAIRVGVSAIPRIPLYYYRVVTIGPGATLEVGNGSAVFTCDELRIHKTGKLKPVKSVNIEIGTWTEFA